MPNLSNQMLGLCGHDGCEEVFEQECQRCGVQRCEDHIARCIHCHQLANYPEMFCHSCAATHEVTKYQRGGCVDQYDREFTIWNERSGDFEALQQRRQERHRRLGY